MSPGSAGTSPTIGTFPGMSISSHPPIGRRHCVTFNALTSINDLAFVIMPPRQEVSPMRNRAVPELGTSLCCVAAPALLRVLAPVEAHSQRAIIERPVKAAPRHDVRVGIYSHIRRDCTSGPLPAIWLVVVPAYRAVNVERVTLKVTNF